MNKRIGKLMLTDLHDGTCVLSSDPHLSMLTAEGETISPPHIRLSKDDVEDLKVLLDALGDWSTSPSPVRSHAQAIVEGAQSLVRDVTRRIGNRCTVDVSLDDRIFFDTVAHCEMSYGCRLNNRSASIQIGDVEISHLRSRRGY